MNKHIGIILITLLGGVLRFYGLGDKPLFIDESLFALWVVEDGLVMQEFVPILLGKLFALDGEFQLRSISALFGTLSIPAMYLVCKENKLTLASFMAFFPLFIFWSRLCRPYAPAIFFITLSWYEYKHKWINVLMFVLALACTPIAAIGVKITKKRLWVIPASIVAGLAFFIIRPDADREFLPMLEYSARWWTIPATVILLYVGLIRFVGWYRYAFLFVASAIWLTSSLYIDDVYSAKDRRWFRQEVRFSNWRNCGEFDFSTNAPVTWFYERNARPLYLRQENDVEYYKRLNNGETLRVGVDYYANFPISKKYFPPQFFNRDTYSRLLWGEQIIKLKVWKDGNNYIMKEFK